jgi:deoxycytidylate deaminase
LVGEALKLLVGDEEKKALDYIFKARDVAVNSSCERSKCGSVIVLDDLVLGSGFNSPAGDLESQRKCSYSKDSYHKKVTDKTCCVHAEQRAIMDALAKNPSKLIGSTLYFVRLDDNDSISRASEPYCTICSKMALDVGIENFVLFKEEGVYVYDTEEYNLISYNFGSKQ